MQIIREGGTEVCVHASREDVVEHFEMQGLSPKAAAAIGGAVYRHEMYYVRQFQHHAGRELQRAGRRDTAAE